MKFILDIIISRFSLVTYSLGRLLFYNEGMYVIGIRENNKI
jgi:hypothetical protein